MIRQHNNKILVVCDGCVAMLVIDTAHSVSVTTLRRHGWRMNTQTRFGWQHFCRSCAVEFRADDPVTMGEVFGISQ